MDGIFQNTCLARIASYPAAASNVANRRLPKTRVLCLPPAPVPVRPVSGGLRAMETEWISVLAGGRAPFLDIFFELC